MKRLLDRVLALPCFAAEPPVLLDIGASGGLPPAWRALAPYSIGVAFDADSREFDVDVARRKEWKALHLHNRLVTDRPTPQVDFHLTESPQCSSVLMPDLEALRPWAFHRMFEISRTVSLPAIDLPSALASSGAVRVDWFKCDSQGTDLRLFKSLPLEVQTRVLAADFEPGIIDAYRGEDKLHQLMAYMDGLPFWVGAMKIKGSQRIGNRDLRQESAFRRRFAASFYGTSPGWCEISYLNRCESTGLGERDLLLAVVIAVIKGQLSFGSDLARRSGARFDNPLFAELASGIEAQLRRGYLRAGADILKAVTRRVFR